MELPYLPPAPFPTNAVPVHGRLVNSTDADHANRFLLSWNTFLLSPQGQAMAPHVRNMTFMAPTIQGMQYSLQLHETRNTYATLSLDANGLSKAFEQFDDRYVLLVSNTEVTTSFIVTVCLNPHQAKSYKKTAGITLLTLLVLFLAVCVSLITLERHGTDLMPKSVSVWWHAHQPDWLQEP